MKTHGRDMPNRIFRDGFVDSEAVSALSDWTHRVYSNLLVKSDDAGRFDGRLEIIRSHLFPLGIARRNEDFTKAVSEMDLNNLVIPYEWGGKTFLQVTKWQRCGSSVTSRFPWRDGSHRIEYVELETRDGSKEFVSTSILDGVVTPSAPRSNGVSIELNTETETETETKTETLSAAKPRAGPGKIADAGKQGKLNAEQLPVWNAFRDWWTFKAWPSRNGGVDYEFDGGRDGRAVKKVLSCRFVKWDLKKAQQLAVAYLDDTDNFLSNRGHTLHDLADRLNRFVGVASGGKPPNRAANGKRQTLDEREAAMNAQARAEIEAEDREARHEQR